MGNKNIVVGLLGNPNSGKTTIFNALTGARQKVANWSGVTVEKREGVLHHNGYTIKVVDLPGTYSLTSYSIEEIITRDFIINEHHDAIINIVDAGNIERNMYLTTQLIEMGTRVVVALNMYDEAISKGLDIDADKLGTLLGMPIIKTVGTRSTGIEELKDAVIRVAERKSLKTRHIHVNYGSDVEKEIQNIQQTIWRVKKIGETYSTRWLAIRLLERDNDVQRKLADYPNYEDILDQAEKSSKGLEDKFKDEIETIFTELRYGFISGAIKESVQESHVKRTDISEAIDRIIINKYLAFPILIIFMCALFQLTFTLGEYPMRLIEKGINIISATIGEYLPNGQLKRMIIDGIIGGVGGVIVFLPNILILFMGISFMEDTGYMARAAFKMDKIMHKLGLHGKSFISLVMGFGCNVPAILATRSLENKQDRILTILINPFMSCSARLPVYILFAGTFFREHAGIIIISLYLIGITLSFLSAKLFKFLFFKGESTPFVMELPPYRMPTLKTTLLHMWDRGSIYLRKVGGIILIFSIIIWILSEYPKSPDIEKKYNNKLSHIDRIFSLDIQKAMDSLSLNSKELDSIKEEHRLARKILIREKKIEEMKYTFIGRFGDIVFPFIKPLGFNWQMGISLSTGFVAKEIVVSTMGVLYHAPDTDADENKYMSLGDILKREEFGITPLIAYTFLLFVLLYIPCLGTVVVIDREAGWPWALFSLFYQIILAWVVCFIFYNTGLLLEF
ncbi:MAG: ferrous iron transport protein B [Spirochaetota bacterium]|nr:ferrous iron transport protein B [Spirochaetota bacterium]